MKDSSDHILDALIVGGGPAGLSCALSLARGGRSLILCDDNNPRNKNAHEIRNLPGHEGMSPHAYREMLKKSLCHYDHVMVRDLQVTLIEKKEDFFLSHFSNHQQVKSKRVVIAEGVEDILPEIPGIKELWGKSVFHCPYCHGYEHVEKEFGVIVNNKKGIQLIRILKGLTDNISVFMNGREIFDQIELEEMRTKDIRIFADKIEHLLEINKKLHGVVLQNNEVVKCATVFIQNDIRPKTQLGIKLGCKLTEGGIYEVDDSGQSNIEGVYFAGDVGSRSHSVIMASALGSHVGICVNADILRNTFRHANCF